MNVGTLTISLAARTAALTAASARVKSFETGVVASAQRMNRSLLMLGQTFSSLTIPIAALGVTATKMFSDFEFELAKVEGLVGIASNTVQKWGDQIVKMAPEVARMPKELGEALYFVTSAGIRGKETMQVLEVSARAAAAGLGETKDVADAITSAMNAYGKENLNAAEAADVLTMAVREGKVVAEDLATSIGKVFPVAAQLSVSFNEVGAAIAAMTRTGTPASTSAIYLRRVLTSMLRPTTAAKNAMAGLGTSFYELRRDLETEGGLLKALMKIKTLVDQFGISAMAEAFPNIRALIPILDIIGKNLDDNKRIWETMLNPIGAVDDATKAASKTFKYQWNQAVAELQSSMVMLGSTLKESLLPVIRDVINWISKAVNWWRNLSDNTQQLIIKITLVIGVLGPLTVIFGGLANVVLNLAGLLFSMTGQFLMLAAAVYFASSMIRQFVQAQKADVGFEDGIQRSNTALEKFMSNLGAYLAVIYQKTKIFSIKIGVLFGDMISGLVNTLADAVNSLIKIYNFIMPMKGLDLPVFVELDIGEYYRKQLKEAEETLKDYEELLPGGDKSWNWADQLFGENSGFKEATKEVWQGFMDDAKYAIDSVKDLLKNVFPKTGASGRTAQSVSELPIQLEKWMTDQSYFMPTASSFDTSNMSDLTNAWNLFGNQIAQVNRKFKLFGNLFDAPAAKFQAFTELFAKFKEQSNLEFTLDDLRRLDEAYRDISFENFDTGIKRINEDYAKFGNLIDITSEKQQLFNTLLANARSVGWVLTEDELNRLKELNWQLNGLENTKNALSSLSSLFSNLGDTISKVFGEDNNLYKFFNSMVEFISIFESFVRIFEAITKLTDLFNASLAVGIGLKEADTIATTKNTVAAAANTTATTAQGVAAGVAAEANTANAIAKLFSAHSWIPFVGAAIAGAGVALLISSLAKGRSATNLADGGIIPGGYPNDTFPANLSSGEAVIPLDRLPQLMGVSQQDTREVTLHIDGRQLTGVLRKQDKFYDAF